MFKPGDIILQVKNNPKGEGKGTVSIILEKSLDYFKVKDYICTYPETMKNCSIGVSFAEEYYVKINDKAKELCLILYE